MEVFANIFSAFGLSASAGMNAYIPLLVVALTGKFFPDTLTLAEPWDVLTSWVVIAVLVALSLIEFFADKIPAVNHVNDAVQTFIRPTAGAILFAATTGTASDINPIFAAVVGLLTAGGVHATKSLLVRPAVTATTAGTGTTPVSLIEDFIAVIVSILSMIIPVIIAVILIIVTSIIVFALWRRIKKKMLKDKQALY